MGDSEAARQLQGGLGVRARPREQLASVGAEGRQAGNLGFAKGYTTTKLP